MGFGIGMAQAMTFSTSLLSLIRYSINSFFPTIFLTVRWYMWELVWYAWL
jgi:hypothetical protein